MVDISNYEICLIFESELLPSRFRFVECENKVTILLIKFSSPIIYSSHTP